MEKKPKNRDTTHARTAKRHSTQLWGNKPPGTQPGMQENTASGKFENRFPRCGRNFGNPGELRERRNYICTQTKAGPTREIPNYKEPSHHDEQHQPIQDLATHPKRIDPPRPAMEKRTKAADGRRCRRRATAGTKQYNRGKCRQKWIYDIAREAKTT